MCKAGQHAPRLTATAVVTDLRRRFSKRLHVADIKNIAGDDQANGGSKFRKYRICNLILRVFTSTRLRLVLNG